jgi:hypothetical protein
MQFTGLSHERDGAAGRWRRGPIHRGNGITQEEYTLIVNLLAIYDDLLGCDNPDSHLAATDLYYLDADVAAYDNFFPDLSR